jgi:hypothetical protein
VESLLPTRRVGSCLIHEILETKKFCPGKFVSCLPCSLPACPPARLPASLCPEPDKRPLWNFTLSTKELFGLSVCQFSHLFFCLSDCSSVRLFVCLSVSFSICSFVCPTVRLFVCSPVRLFVFESVFESVFLTLGLFVLKDPEHRDRQTNRATDRTDRTDRQTDTLTHRRGFESTHHLSPLLNGKEKVTDSFSSY